LGPVCGWWLRRSLRCCIGAAQSLMRSCQQQRDLS